MSKLKAWYWGPNKRYWEREKKTAPLEGKVVLALLLALAAPTAIGLRAEFDDGFFSGISAVWMGIAFDFFFSWFFIARAIHRPWRKARVAFAVAIGLLFPMRKIASAIVLEIESNIPSIEEAEELGGLIALVAVVSWLVATFFGARSINRRVKKTEDKRKKKEKKERKREKKRQAAEQHEQESVEQHAQEPVEERFRRKFAPEWTPEGAFEAEKRAHPAPPATEGKETP